MGPLQVLPVSLTLRATLALSRAVSMILRGLLTPRFSDAQTWVLVTLALQLLQPGGRGAQPSAPWRQLGLALFTELTSRRPPGPAAGLRPEGHRAPKTRSG